MEYSKSDIERLVRKSIAKRGAAETEKVLKSLEVLLENTTLEKVSKDLLDTFKVRRKAGITNE